MTATDELRALLTKPQESLGVELKRWIDPTAPEATAKIAIGCIALRNNNGGLFVVGFTDEGEPDGENVPADVRKAFHPDDIQAVVSKYASDLFPVEVHFVERDGQEYPVISVPPGVTTPVCAKAGLPGGKGLLVKPHAVYVRTLHSNNTVSSAEARSGDWEKLTRICFDNREADIGAFVRRHLSGLDLPQLTALLGGAAPPPAPTAVERATFLLTRGRARFETVVGERRVRLPSPLGFREAAIVIDGVVPEHSASRAFLVRLSVAKRDYSGWPPWLTGSHGSVDPECVFDGGWESFLYYPDSPVLPPSLDFWRIDPRGEFYHLDGLPDDFLLRATGAPPGKSLDVLAQIKRVAEFITAAQSFARTMGCTGDNTSLACAFRWSGLSGRRLVSRGSMMWLRSNPPAVQDEVRTSVVIPLDVPASAIAPFVHRAVREMFLVFGGTAFEDADVESWVKDTLNM